MTQKKFLKFCENKFTNKLTNAIEYMYKILVDKNIQIKLLTKKNETLNEENIRLNKINIQMETMIYYYEKILIIIKLIKMIIIIYMKIFLVVG